MYPQGITSLIPPGTSSVLFEAVDVFREGYGLAVRSAGKRFPPPLPFLQDSGGFQGTPVDSRGLGWVAEAQVIA